MINKEKYGKMIEDFILNLTHNFINKLKTKEKLEGIILTGSFASWLRGKKTHQPSWKVVPDVNYYPLINGTEEDIIYIGHVLFTSITETIKNYVKNYGLQYNIILDLHPFSISSFKPIFKDNIINVQLTTRVINLRQKDRYPDYSWYGWTTNYIVLYPKDIENKDLLRFYYTKPKRDKIWIRNMYLALLSYGNVLQVLPLYTSDNEHLIFESYRYLKEISKDGVSLALTNNEFENGKFYEIITQWKNKISDFYRERYGKDAADIIELLVDMEDNYIKYVKDYPPISLIKKCIKLRNIVFERGFKGRLKELDPKNEIFLNLPLWW